MKRLFLFAAAAVMSVVFALTACQKENDPVDVSQLVGKWHETGIIGATENYTFDNDGRYTLVISYFPNGSVSREGTYEVSDDRILTLFDENGDTEDQYILLELNSGAMKWRELMYGGEPREATFAKTAE
jgi:hypothetical protein